ncbi:MAG TPA: proton-conducting transporter membrane subunit, partial [Bryobacteraceae bacterium]|nr:proton-conducting transporter membrane subunit [Bryobacteraceae bacterium]
MPSTAIQLLIAALALYACGAAAGLSVLAGLKRARNAAFALPVAGAILQSISSVMALVSRSQETVAYSSGIPLIEYALRLDAISAVFSLALGLLAAAVSVYSFGYFAAASRTRMGVLAFFYNVLLLSLTLVFTAANAFFFLIAWEVMAASAYCLVSADHEKEETRHAGLLFLIMSHAGTGLLIVGFLLLASASGSLDFASFHLLGSELPPLQGGIVLLLFLMGFGVKAGIIPLHIWLPAAHPVAPSNVSALMSGIVIKTGIYGMVRVLFDFY